MCLGLSADDLSLETLLVLFLTYRIILLSLTRQKENVTQKTEKHGNGVKSWSLKSRKQLKFQEKTHI